ncbi:CRISPR-associated endoribonuclease [Prolixibacter sp. NT017]|nr:CRISPR-associated endoribonuclease [Prolixibacter sp. NT017]
MLPMDYQYFIGAWVYKVLRRADGEFAEFLHAEGYKTEKKRFKLFSYSPLELGRPKVWKEKALFELQRDMLILKVAFHLSEAAERFIIGLFNQQEFFLGDRFNGIDLTVSGVERLSEPMVALKSKYRATSPVVISTWEEGDKYAQYLSPKDKRYEELLKQHLVHKYDSVPGVEPLPHDFPFRFTLTSTPKSKLTTIKPYSPGESKVRGFKYHFELTAPAQLHQLILSAGMGEKNATGFGWVEPSPSVVSAPHSAKQPTNIK